MMKIVINLKNVIELVNFVQVVLQIVQIIIVNLVLKDIYIHMNIQEIVMKLMI